MVEIRETAAFSGWLAGLRDVTARAIIAARAQRLTRNLQGDVRPVGRGISEMRIHYGQDIAFISCNEAKG